MAKTTTVAKTKKEKATELAEKKAAKAAHKASTANETPPHPLMANEAMNEDFDETIND